MIGAWLTETMTGCFDPALLTVTQKQQGELGRGGLLFTQGTFRDHGGWGEGGEGGGRPRGGEEHSAELGGFTAACCDGEERAARMLASEMTAGFHEGPKCTAPCLGVIQKVVEQIKPSNESA